LLYGNGTDGYAALAAVATGNSLISGGAGAAPSWGKIGLATHLHYRTRRLKHHLAHRRFSVHGANARLRGGHAGVLHLKPRQQGRSIDRRQQPQSERVQDHRRWRHRFGNSTVLIRARSTSNATVFRICDSTLSTVTSVTDGSGLFSIVRPDSNTKRAYRNATQTGAERCRCDCTPGRTGGWKAEPAELAKVIGRRSGRGMPDGRICLT
jgi:hypothetical protein